SARARAAGPVGLRGLPRDRAPLRPQCRGRLRRPRRTRAHAAQRNPLPLRGAGARAGGRADRRTRRMNRVLVGIATPLDPGLVAEIAAVDEQVEVVDTPAAFSQAEVLLLGAPRDAPALQEAVRGNDRLRWVHSIWAGAGE